MSAPAGNHWSADGWNQSHDCDTRDTGLGLHFVDLPTDKLARDDEVQFTFYWRQARRWEGKNFEVTVQDLPDVRQDPRVPVERSRTPEYASSTKE